LFKVITAEDTIRIPPEKFGNPLDQVALDQMKAKYEGIVTEDLGYVVAVINIDVDPVGKIIPGDGSTYHRVIFTLLTYRPEIQEIVEGEVVEIEDFGAFVRVGPIDALLHVSQIIDDFVSYDERQTTLIAKESRRVLKQGDRVRARITAVSFAHGGMSGKIGITMRQPFLGKLEWIEDDLKRVREGVQSRRPPKQSGKEERTR
jgi:DNA-directed RNA polymerase subunit E'